MRILPSLFGVLCLASCVGSLPAADTTQSVEAAEPKSYIEALQAHGVKLTKGPATVKLGNVAQLDLPRGFYSVNSESLKTYYDVTHNSYAGNEAGVIISPDPAQWMLVFKYDDSGYVKDDEKDDLDADKLLKSTQEGQSEANEDRKKRGWDEIRVMGWATAPYYDQKTHNLKWAYNLSSSDDGYKATWINESIRLLGRGGVMKVTLVSGNDTFKTDALAADKLLAEKFNYVSGQKYAEFRPGDKVAKYGLAALVVGGATAVAFKTGLLAKLWKPIAIALAAAAAWVKKLMNKITGRNPS